MCTLTKFVKATIGSATQLEPTGRPASQADGASRQAVYSSSPTITIRMVITTNAITIAIIVLCLVLSCLLLLLLLSDCAEQVCREEAVLLREVQQRLSHRGSLNMYIYIYIYIYIFLVY